MAALRKLRRQIHGKYRVLGSDCETRNALSTAASYRRNQRKRQTAASGTDSARRRVRHCPETLRISQESTKRMRLNGMDISDEEFARGVHTIHALVENFAEVSSVPTTLF